MESRNNKRTNQMKNKTKIVVTVLQLAGLAWFGLSPKAQAVVPPPDGGYPGFNTAEGQNALFNLGAGVANTAVGWYSLQNDTDGSYNSAVGAGTLLFNGSGNANTAIGTAALLFNTVGIENTAVGVAAMRDNTEGSDNTAVGINALLSNTIGHQNTATGTSALFFNTLGLYNTANGAFALVANTEGVSNTAVGWGALLNNQTGNNNTAIGVRAGQNIPGDNNICIGSQVFGVAGETNTIRIGDNLTAYSACYIGGIRGQSVDPGTAHSVLIDSQSKVGSLNSARRFKQDIKPMDEASEAILALKPVAFHYKSDPKNTPCFGLIAEEVENVSPALVVHDKDGQPYSVRYDQVNAMLLNEFLKEHRKVEKLEVLIARQRKDFEAALTDLKGQIQRVSAQLELNKPALQTVKNND
jgi:hypothetical protein